MAQEPWYVTAFRAEYRYVYPQRDLESARAEVDHLLAAGIEGRVLDLCCGFGRHTLALAQRGVDVLGVDLSQELLSQAADLSGDGLLAGRLLCADARAVPCADGAFDALLVLFSSFGYFGEEGDARVLGEISRLLREGGRAVLDLMNPAHVRANLEPASSSERGSAHLEERRELLDGGRVVAKRVRLVLADGRELRWREEVRMYETYELAKLLTTRGLEVVSIEGDFTGAPFGLDSPRQILHLLRT